MTRPNILGLITIVLFLFAFMVLTRTASLGLIGTMAITSFLAKIFYSLPGSVVESRIAFNPFLVIKLVDDITEFSGNVIQCFQNAIPLLISAP